MSETNENAAAFEKWWAMPSTSVIDKKGLAVDKETVRWIWDAAYNALPPVDAAAVAKGIAGMPTITRMRLAIAIDTLFTIEDGKGIAIIADILRPFLPTPGAGTGGEGAAQNSMSGGYYIGELAGVGLTAQVNNGTDANVMGALFKGLLADSATLARARELAGERRSLLGHIIIGNGHDVAGEERRIQAIEDEVFNMLLSPAPKGEVRP